MGAPPRPQCVILIGIPASGKSTFFNTELVDTHLRINLDMLRTRHREKLLFQACLEGGISCAIDNTNPSRADRARYIEDASEAGFQVVGYYFRSAVKEALVRNKARSRVVPAQAIRAISNRLQLPSYHEGFDQLWYVEITADGQKKMEWSDDL